MPQSIKRELTTIQIRKVSMIKSIKMVRTKKQSGCCIKHQLAVANPILLLFFYSISDCCQYFICLRKQTVYLDIELNVLIFTRSTFPVEIILSKDTYDVYSSDD